MAFVVMPWPAGLIAVPVLAVFAVVLSAMTGHDGWQRPTRILLITAATAIVLGCLLLTVLWLVGS